MLKLNATAFSVLLLTLAIGLPSAFAAGTDEQVVTLSPSSGTLTYSIYQTVSIDKEVTTFIEISDTEDGAGLPTSQMTLLLLDDGSQKETGLQAAREVSFLDLLKLGGVSPSGPSAMKTGTVKFFNDAKGKKIYVGNLPFSASDARVISLPDEVQKFVSEAKPQAPREKSRTVIIFDIQEGKKGLNAVNVKKA